MFGGVQHLARPASDRKSTQPLPALVERSSGGAGALKLEKRVAEIAFDVAAGLATGVAFTGEASSVTGVATGVSSVTGVAFKGVASSATGVSSVTGEPSSVTGVAFKGEASPATCVAFEGEATSATGVSFKGEAALGVATGETAVAVAFAVKP